MDIGDVVIDLGHDLGLSLSLDGGVTPFHKAVESFRHGQWYVSD